MDAISAMVPMLIRSIATRGRLIAMGVFGAIGVIIAIAVRQSESGGEDLAVPLITNFGLVLLVPVVALVVASATLGQLVENRTLVYLWLRPVAPWKIAIAAVIAGLVIVVPLVVVPLVAIGAVLGQWSDMLGAAVAAALGGVGYVSIFTTVGLMTQRALAFGLAYILVWEGFIAGLSRAAARFALRTHTSSALAQIADVPDLITDPYRVTTVVIVAAGVLIAGLAMTSWRLGAMEID